MRTPLSEFTPTSICWTFRADASRAQEIERLAMSQATFNMSDPVGGEWIISEWRRQSIPGDRFVIQVVLNAVERIAG